VDLAAVERIYVRAPNWVGDLVMATASFQRIRSAFPHAGITCGLRPYLRPLLSGNPYFDHYLDTPRVGGLGGLRGLWRQVSGVRAGRFGLAVVLPNSFETGLVPFLARVPIRLGYRQGRPGLMTLGLKVRGIRRAFHRHGPRREPKPMPEYYRELLDLLQLPPGPAKPVLPVREEDRVWIQRWLQDRSVDPQAPLVLVNPGASFGASKLWLPERFAEVATHYKQKGLTPVVLAGPAEIELAQKIAAQAGVVAANDPVIPLDRLRALVERARLMITTDTGPRHIAVALGVPVVCVMGPTDPRYTNYALETQRVLQKQLPCVPCHRKTCPLGHHDCMRGISVEEVVAAGEELLRIS
jgi:heptosyltransferase-2